MKTVSLVIPVFDEVDSIQPFLTRTNEALCPLEEQGYQFELVFVNDGSSDETLARLLQALKDDSRLRIIDFSRNFGKEAALTAGLEEAAGDAVIPIDVDLQHPPEVIKDLIAKWEEGFEVVLARRLDTSLNSPFKRIASHWFYRIHNWIADPHIPNDVGDFRLLDRTVVEALRQLPERRRFMKGLFAWVGFRTTTTEYQLQPRGGGRSRFSTWKRWKLALEGLTSFSTAPLRLWTYLGLTVAMAAFLFALLVISRTVIFGIDVPGYASLLVAILFLGGIQLIGIGVLGEYLGRIYVETKQRPTYVVRRRYPGGHVNEARRLPDHKRANLKR